MTTHPIPAHASFPSKDADESTPAVDAVLTLVSVLQHAEVVGDADLFPVVITNEDGGEDIALVYAIDNALLPGTTGYGVAGVLFHEKGTNEATLAWAQAIKVTVLAALDREFERQDAANQATDERYAAEEDA
jgi:hypothetical protein